MKIEGLESFKNIKIVDYPIISAELDPEEKAFTIELEGCAIKEGNEIAYYGPGFITFYDWDTFSFLRLVEGKLEVDTDIEPFDEITKREFDGDWVILGGYAMDDWCEYRIKSPKIRGQFALDEIRDPS